jgi:hypothetical protein
LLKLRFRSKPTAWNTGTYDTHSALGLYEADGPWVFILSALKRPEKT